MFNILKLDVSTPDVQHAVAKTAVVAIAAGTSWTLQDISHIVSICAGTAGFVYSLMLIGEWLWKKFNTRARKKADRG